MDYFVIPGYGFMDYFVDSSYGSPRYEIEVNIYYIACRIDDDGVVSGYDGSFHHVSKNSYGNFISPDTISPGTIYQIRKNSGSYTGIVITAINEVTGEYIYHYDYTVNDSYELSPLITGGFALRTPASTASLVLSIRMATWTATTTAG